MYLYIHTHTYTHTHSTPCAQIFIIITTHGPLKKKLIYAFSLLKTNRTHQIQQLIYQFINILYIYKS